MLHATRHLSVFTNSHAIRIHNGAFSYSSLAPAILRMQPAHDTGNRWTHGHVLKRHLSGCVQSGCVWSGCMCSCLWSCKTGAHIHPYKRVIQQSYCGGQGVSAHFESQDASCQKPTFVCCDILRWSVPGYQAHAAGRASYTRHLPTKEVRVSASHYGRCA